MVFVTEILVLLFFSFCTAFIIIYGKNGTGAYSSYLLMFILIFIFLMVM